MNVYQMVKYVKDLQLFVQQHNQEERELIRSPRAKGQLKKFLEGYCVLVINSFF